MPRMTKKQKTEMFWQRVKHVRSNPHDVTEDEMKSYNFLCGLIAIPRYGKTPEVIWKNDQRNGRYTIKHQMHNKGQSRSGKTHYWYNWFDVLDHEQNATFQVSHYVNDKGQNILKGNEKNIYED